MLDGLLNRNNFRTKCKSAITRTKTRLEVIKKKRNAMQKFLKKDIADLLKSNLDRNAYGRAEGMYNELNLTSCYEYVGQCCTCISEHLKEIAKERECPNDCKVAVSSLVYAAARFSDLPELRDLRNQFNEKYDKSLESFISEEFVEKLKSKPPTTEMKIQLMQEIAQEFSITWDSLPLQQQLYTDQGIEKSKKLASDKMFKSMSTVAQVKAKQEDNNKLMKEEQKDKLRTRRHNSYSKFNAHVSEVLQEQNNIKEEKIHTSLEGDAENNLYRKPFTKKTVSATSIVSDEHGADKKNKEIGSRDKEPNNPNSSYELWLNNKDDDHDDDDLFSIRKPRPRSVRTKFLNSSPSSPTSSSEHEIDVREVRSGKAPQERKHGVFIPEENEEEVVDKLMMRYSANRPSNAHTPSNARNKRFPTSPEKEDNATLTSALPPPPGRRRYLFVESLPASPMKEAGGQTSSGQSKFLPPDYQQLA